MCVSWLRPSSFVTKAAYAEHLKDRDVEYRVEECKALAKELTYAVHLADVDFFEEDHCLSLKAYMESKKASASTKK